MKEINQEQLLKLSNVEKCEVLKAIILGKIEYIGEPMRYKDYDRKKKKIEDKKLIKEWEEER